jgi:Fe-S-cluster containining protein
MKRLPVAFDDILAALTEKPAEMTEYAREQMNRVRELLRDMPGYNCPAACNHCCHGSILMSYVEYVAILNALEERYGKEPLRQLFAGRLGLLEEEGKLLCPFVNDDREAEHCGIYTDRPLICRVFGTTASPCPEDIEHPHFPEGPFFRAYNLLYYVEDGSFIGLPLSDTLALYEAPFDIWAIADSGRVDQLLDIFMEHGSMRAVICDVPQNRFFTLLPGGERHYLEE